MANLKDLIVNGTTRFIGTAYANTPTAGDSSKQVATTAFVEKEITSAISDISGKANTDFDNVSPTGKSTSISWGMPDYSAGVAKSSGTQHTAEVDGWLEIRTDDYNNRSYLTLNGIEKCISGADNNHLAGIYCIIPIPKNATFKVVFSRTSADNLCNFYPCKGAN